MSGAAADEPRRTVGLLRRLAAAACDTVPALLAVWLLFALGVFDATIFSPPADWFWTEWALKHWLDRPERVVEPVVATAVFGVSWVAGWELATGRTPGARLVGLAIVDQRGFIASRSRLAVRHLGIVMNLASLGLGYLWIIASTYRRGWHDAVSGTYVVDE